MKQLVNRLSYYLCVFQTLLRLSIMEILIFRINALIMGLAPIIWMATVLIFIGTLFSRIKTLGGWNLWQVVFLTGTHEIIFITSWATFQTNLRTFIRDVQTGKFDQTLLKPVNPRFLISFKSMDFTSIGSFINVVLIFGLSFGKIVKEVELSRLAAFPLFLIEAYLVCYFVYFIAAELTLFFVNSRTFIDLIFDTADFARYPAEIYPSTLKTFLTFALPVLFFAYIPTAFLLGKIGWEYLSLGAVVILSLYLISDFLWQKGLKHYSSASS